MDGSDDVSRGAGAGGDGKRGKLPIPKYACCYDAAIGPERRARTRTQQRRRDCSSITIAQQADITHIALQLPVCRVVSHEAVVDVRPQMGKLRLHATRKGRVLPFRDGRVPQYLLAAEMDDASLGNIKLGGVAWIHVGGLDEALGNCLWHHRIHRRGV